MSATKYFNVQCKECGQHIEGEMDGFERMIQCPKCSAYMMARPTEPQPTSDAPAPTRPVSPDAPTGNPRKEELAATTNAHAGLTLGTENDTEYLKMVCPHCEGVFEFPAEYYESSHPCPHCKNVARLVPRPSRLPPREYELFDGGVVSGPFLFAQVFERWKAGEVTLNSMYRFAPNSDWQSIRQLKLNAYGTQEEALFENEVIVYVKFPNLAYPKGPYSFRELAQLEKHKLSNCLFWWPTITYWIDSTLLAMVDESEKNLRNGNPELSNRLVKTIQNPAQMEPPAFSRVMSGNDVMSASYMKPGTPEYNHDMIVARFWGFVVVCIIIYFCLKGCS
jgi:DNA-directed RNA polymerase subunit RPC12/RpoP